MGLSNVFKKMESFADKIKELAENSESGKTTIMHPEVYQTKEDAEKANKDVNFRSYYSSRKEASRRLL